MPARAAIESVDVRAYEIPTPTAEADGTLSWDATVLVICSLCAAGREGIGYSYANRATADVIHRELRSRLLESDALQPRATWMRCWQQLRNLGRPGISSMAIAAADMAAWNLFARLLDQPLFRVLGAYREGVAAHGSGGFTSCSDEELADELDAWTGQGLAAAKIKIGRDESADRRRVERARKVLRADQALFVDGNGAYDQRQALETASWLGNAGVSWFEESVSSEDFAGMRWLRQRGPVNVRIVTGEYGYRPDDFLRWLDAGAVDVLMADATRTGVSGFLDAAVLSATHHIPFSSHCAPTIHAHLGCAARNFLNAEYFVDHVRIQQQFFDGAIGARAGRLTPDPSATGIGITPKLQDLDSHAI